MEIFNCEVELQYKVKVNVDMFTKILPSRNHTLHIDISSDSMLNATSQLLNLQLKSQYVVLFKVLFATCLCPTNRFLNEEILRNFVDNSTTFPPLVPDPLCPPLAWLLAPQLDWLVRVVGSRGAVEKSPASWDPTLAATTRTRYMCPCIQPVFSCLLVIAPHIYTRTLLEEVVNFAH